jgi:hypothetical protein
MLKTASKAGELEGRVVEVFIGSKTYRLSGNWQWDLHCNAIFCSDVMFSLSRVFEGTKGIVHPDDLAGLKEKLFSFSKKQPVPIEFRIITTYGEVKTLQGKQILLADTIVENDSEADLSVRELRFIEM